MKNRAEDLAGKRIGIFGKGGAGKSTVAVLLAKALRAIGYEVALLDADSTNVGLSAALGVERPTHSLIDWFGGMVFSGGAVTCPVDDPTPLPGADLWLARLPTGLAVRAPDGVWLLEAGKIGHRGPGAGCDGPIAKIARDVRIRADGKDPVTVVDFKAGFEDSARGVITTLDRAIVIVDPTRAAVQMAADTKEMVRQIRSGVPPATRHLDQQQLVDLVNALYGRSRIQGIHCVLNRIPDQETERFLRVRLAEHGIDPIGVIHDHGSVAVSWLQGRALDLDTAREEVRGVAEYLNRSDTRREPAAVGRAPLADRTEGRRPRIE
jgi:CO dehydrogenase nickel-insertion accessory protein CooC1